METAGPQDHWLFHVLTPHKALSIITKNAFRLPLSETNSSEAALGAVRMYYMSFARTPNSGYIADRSRGLRRVQDPVLLVFDRTRLTRMRGVVVRPVQYFNVDGVGRAMGSAREAEERLFYAKPILPGVLRSLAEIRIMIDPDDRHSHGPTRAVWALAKKMRLPVKLFTWSNFQGYLHGRETREDRAAAVALLRAAPNIGLGNFARRNDPGYAAPYDSDARSATIVAKKLGPSWRSRNYLPEWVYQTDYSKLTKDARSGLASYLGYGVDEGAKRFWESYSSTVHNLRAGRASEQDKFNRMLAHMRATSPRDLFDKLIAKWIPLRDAYNAAEQDRYYAANPHKIPQRDFFDYLGSLVDQPDPPGYYGRYGTSWGRTMRDIIDSAVRPYPSEDGTGHPEWWRAALDRAKAMAADWKPLVKAHQDSW